MKNRNPYLPLVWIVCFLHIAVIMCAQLPARQWSRKYGGSSVDVPYSIKYTNDGGTIVVGYTTSKDGDVAKHTPRDNWDLWVLKLDRCGNIQWERSFGGSNYESARDVAQTADGGFIVLGETNSSDGGVVAGPGSKDIWLLKLDGSGNLQWQKRYGGSQIDIGNHIHLMDNGNFLVAASSSSNDGDIKGNHTTGTFTDGVLMEINSAGVLLWSKCFGGTRNDELLDVKIIGNRIYASGYANSVDGDIPPSQKNYDVWLLALDMSGNKVYSKVYGGSQNDVAYAMTVGADGTITMAGYTTSVDGDVSGAKGRQDFWVLNVTTAGALKWQRVVGGSEEDLAASVFTDSDGGYIVGGISYSEDGDITDAKGEGDYWVVKLDPSGNVMWQQSLGGKKSDNLHSMIYQPVLKEFYLAGDAESGDDDFTAGKGEADFAIIKLKALELVTVDSAVCSMEGFYAEPDTLQDACGYDSAIVTYKAILLPDPFYNIATSDTIFEGRSLQLTTVANATNIKWDYDPSLSCTSCPDPVAAPAVTTVYTATNYLDHCSAQGSFTLVVLKDAVIKVPNAFTPNGDGRSDQFGALGLVPGEFRMQIFNRYGEIVFQSTSVSDKWNGKFRGVMQPGGAFIYYIRYKNILNQPQQKRGTFLLIR